jgi:hypothetical protein
MGLTSWDTAADKPKEFRAHWAEAINPESGYMDEEPEGPSSEPLDVRFQNEVADYASAVQFLDANYEEFINTGSAGSNNFEALCVEAGILPTAEELRNPEFTYDWFCALYYSQPQLLAKLEPETVSMIVSSFLRAAANDPDQLEFLQSVLVRPKWAQHIRKDKHYY